MAISDQIQMLISAFIFGLLFQATVAALLLYIKGHGSAIFKDHRRLVLVLFLTSTALWAQVDFVNFTVPSTSPNACQVTIIASTFFDQVARIIIEGFLLWSVGHVKKTPAESSGLCALMGVRTVMGVIFVAYARPQFAPVCVARSDSLAVSVTVIVLDMIIIGILAIRALTLGLLRVIKEVRQSTNQEQSKALVYCTAALLLWTLTSSAMMIGMPSIVLLLRTALPAIGLTILVSILTIYLGALVLARHDDLMTPEARSPFVAPIHSSSGLGDDNGSLIRETGYPRTANLSIVNPSSAHNTSVMKYLEEVKAEDSNYTGYRSVRTRAVQDGDVATSPPEDNSSNRASSGVFQSLSAATIEVISSAAFLAAPRQTPVPSSANKVNHIGLPSLKDTSDVKERQKRARFGWSKKSAGKSVHKITISKPVMGATESLSAQPFARMRTIDLASAAVSERERREGISNRQLVAKRPAPPPPTAEEARRKSNCIRRKEIPRGNSAPLIMDTSKKTANESGLPVTVNTSSTSASLSPGREEVRRRSPRSIKILEGDIEKACFLASRPKTILVPDEDTQQTVMYVNDIVYDHPGIVKSIIKEAPTLLRKSKSEFHRKRINSPISSNTLPESIMHRPRSYRRESEKDRVFFTSEPSPRHKRSKSGPCHGIRKNNLQSNAHVMDVLAQPQRPTTASALEKLLPNDTRGMSVDEKISLLFPAPPRVHHVRNRRSSVPSLPRIPSSILGDSSTNVLMDQELQDHRSSKRTTISFGSQIQHDGKTPISETPIINDHGIYRLSANTYRTLAGSPGGSRISELPRDIRNINNSNSNEMQTSNSRRNSNITSSGSEGDGSHGDPKSAWASIHSPIPAIDVKTAQRTARETHIRMRKDTRAMGGGVTSKLFSGTSPQVEDEESAIGDGEGLMTVMFGIGDIAPPQANMRSFLSNPSPILPDNEVFIPSENGAWHRRIGDELPAFSQRRKYLGSRTMPPPTPLLLRSNRRQPPIVVREPLVERGESPESPLKKIRAQLSRFDGTSRESLGSLMHQIPGDSLKSSKFPSDDRQSLIANLEEEMGQQETLWMQMQYNFNRDSDSMIITPQVAELTPLALPSPPSETSPRKTLRSVNRRPRIRTKVAESATANSASSTYVSKANIWQQRLAEADMEFKENASAALAVGNINFLFTSKSKLGSPTPPESVDSESDLVTEMDYNTDEENYCQSLVRALSSINTNPNALWEPKPLAPSIRVGHLWSTPRDLSTLRSTLSEPAAKELRPIRRRDQHNLTIVSSKLWSKPTLNANQSPIGLWESRIARPRTITTRPRAQRPQRKSKRVTFLPDIVESPSPLPHKGDTLGIFQFPWGEKSDSAVYNPIPATSPASLSPCSLSCNSEQKQAQTDSEPTEYPSSFFDDYEDNYEGESELNSDDDFDESTLWEIATLLDSQHVPSRDSLFPFPRIIEDYVNDDDSDIDLAGNTFNSNHSSASAWQETVNFIPVNPLKPLPPLPIVQEKDGCERTPSAVRVNFQQATAPLPQGYLLALNDSVGAEPCERTIQNSQTPSNANARVRWDKAIGAVSYLPVEKAIALWTRKSSDAAKKPSFVSEHGSVEDSSQLRLWTAPKPEKVQQSLELFTTDIQHEDYRTDYQVPAVLTTIQKPRFETKHLATLSSQHLWSPNMNSSSERNWIISSSIQGPSLSLHSASSSGGSSPDTDKQSAASTATRVSSIAAAKDANRGRLWYDTEASPSDGSQPADLEKPPTVNLSPKRPLILQGSRILASRDLWESRASMTDSALTRKPQRSSKVNVPNAIQWTQRTTISEVTKTEVNSTSKVSNIHSSDYDCTVRHPVFFASEMVSDASFIHPAAIGYVLQLAISSAEAPKTSELWVPSSATNQVPSNTSPWTKSLSTEDGLNVTVQPANCIQPVRRTKGLPPLNLPALSPTTSFWRPTAPKNSVKHWLHATALRTLPASAAMVEQLPLPMLFANTILEQSQAPDSWQKVQVNSLLPVPNCRLTWTATKRSNTLSEIQGMGLWVPAEDKDHAVEEFSVVLGVSTTRPNFNKHPSRQAGPDKIESTELWRRKWGLAESPKDWLRSPRATKVDFRY